MNINELERKNGLVYKIDNIISHFSEEELDMVFKYVVGIYRMSEACKVDKLIRETKKKSA